MTQIYEQYIWSAVCVSAMFIDVPFHLFSSGLCFILSSWIFRAILDTLDEMRLLHVLALAAPFRHVLAVGGTPGNPADLAKQYRINFDTNDNGGCKGYQDLLQNSYGEAFSAAKAAEDSLAFFLADPRPQQRQDPTGFARWVRIGKAFVALFGVSNMPGAIKKDVARECYMFINSSGAF